MNINTRGFRTSLASGILGIAILTASVFADPTIENATGDQSAGVTATSPPVLTLNVYDLTGSINPASGVTGISLTNNGAANLTINSGVAGTPVNVVTTGANDFGINVVSVGSPPSNPTPDPFLGVPIPTASTTAGGVVQVTSYTNITTSGVSAAGIVAQSSTTGYPSGVVQQLQNFTGTGFTFAVNGVTNANGTAGTIGQPVTATMVDANGNVIPGAAGTFTINANGTYTFNPGTAFSTLAVGQSVNVEVNYSVLGTNPQSHTESDAGVFVVTVTNTGANGLSTTAVGSSFDQFGAASTILPTAQSLQAYVNSLAGIAAAGGPGNSVTVTSTGTIQTNATGATGVNGAYANGIYATSQGGNGSGGSNATILHSSTQGGVGSNGGNVTVTANGSISTSQDNAVGVVAWSLGGTGGTGGNSGYTRNSKAGGGGGNGGVVDVYGSATIITIGNQASGIIALSQGGNGGGGGSGSTFDSADDGGPGGQGGTVDVEGSWNITTSGTQADGIWAKSLGGIAGGGGDGGWTGTSAGSGGVGTAGGNVIVVSNGTITTNQADSYGIYGESVGGFGGNGGNGTSIFYSTGGSGASAGSGGTVTITNGATGVIITNGVDSHAIFGQSIGGGGGSGGDSAALVGLGGSGSTGGDGSAVTITNNGTIMTFGAGSRGIYAQSVGGGGGDGGDSAGLVAIGGSGSTTSSGGNVTVINTGSIQTTSNAIFAQSIGGGGGSGGSSAGWFSFGGTSGAGGDAGTVIVSSNGNLTTTEANASAIFAQSVGGGGGNGGNSTAVGLVVSLSMGGQGGVGGAGGDVSVGVNPTTGVIDPVTGVIITSNDFSRGIEAQSIGGGGGNGGFAFSVSAGTGSSAAIAIGGNGSGGGAAGNVSVYFGDAASSITTNGAEADGIFAQSVGGGGGAGGFSVAATVGAGYNAAVSLGGSGGTGNNGGIVTVGGPSNYTGGSITTLGAHSVGILAQSVGGGGGDGGFSIAATASLGFAGGSLSFGGNGSAGGAGGDVTVYSGTTISTTGNDSEGILAQSVGGGGGSGGYSIAGTFSAGAAVGLSFGGQGGGGAAAGDVTVYSNGASIGTGGDHSYGILAQSIGGSGGDGGFSITAGVGIAPAIGFSMGGGGGTAGEGGNVTLVNSSAVTTTGNDSHAVFAQSVGGGGGSGGFSIAASISGGGGGAAAVNASIGGAGAAGSDAQTVTVSQSIGAINTSGDHSDGIIAQSIGGGGGDGGFSIAGGISSGPAVSFSMGGAAGNGGSGGQVYVDSSSQITTTGNDSNAIFAQSVGGGGGNGGFSVVGNISVNSAGVGVSIGGGGGNGAIAQSVTVGYNNAITGGITTTGNNSDGIVAQSIGGGGGNGGFSLTGDLSASAAVGFSMGGGGGTGNLGGTVVVNSGTSITTSGVDSTAIFAQSVGGGGGSGGFSVSGSISPVSGGGAVTVSIGGTGGTGGDGNTVSVTSTGATIITGADFANGNFGNGSDGILAQSIGGGGGNGGFSVASGLSSGPAVSFTMGGSGGAAGIGNTVQVDSSSNITTYGSDSNGIFAQSVGGGGGNGGFSIAGSLSTQSAGVSASIGGKGAGGGNGGDVTVGYNNPITGSITTYGDGSNGIVAQSVGGGGGNGGFSVTLDLSSSAAVGFSMGGGGGTASNGGTVILNSAASISTGGSDANAIFAQSVGGGGGNGGFSIAGGVSANNAAVSASVGGTAGMGGIGGLVTVTSTGATINTAGDSSDGILAQSVGGGGGDGGFSLAGGVSKTSAVNVSIGGSGGAGGSAMGVGVTNSSDITTIGQLSDGLLAQSVGGGGGAGGFSLAGSVSTSGNGVSFSMGGGGGVAGDGSTVVVSNTGDISTGGVSGTGQGSYGILAQSIGGGGGAGGFSGSFSGSFANGNGVAVSVGGFGGAGGAANTVQVTNSGAITTTADGSTGIFAQSIGGGGGDGGFSMALSLAAGAQKSALSVSIGGNGATGGDGSTVTVLNTQSIQTSGDNSQGIFAQSIGGGGGNGGFSIGTAGGTGDEAKGVSVTVGGQGGTAGNGALVSVTNTAAITTTGDDSSAIQAQSIGGGGGDGGFSLSGALGGQTGKSLSVSVGGFGGAGGTGGEVDVLGTGGNNTLNTSGDRSDGILAQSIGGGGGNGGFSASVALGAGGTEPNMPSTSIGISVGGSGGTGNFGGTVNVGLVSSPLTGDITTSGQQAIGILAQSIGGGGGTGGFSLSGSINLTPQQTEQMSGPNTNIALAIGGGGGNANNGGNVNVYYSGTISTSGDGSYGIQAQSIGGGGGDGGSAQAFTLQLGPAPPATLKNATNANKSLSLAIGGNGAGGSSAGIVTVVNVGDITTTGGDAYGIFAQSIGGGGGSGGDGTQGVTGSGLLKTYNRSNFKKNLTIVVGGSGGSSGDGNTVNITNTGNIITYGDGSHGVSAQSIGGGGGEGGNGVQGATGTIGVGGGSGTTGNGGAINITINGSITTYGNGANGIFAQSVGGGGGAAGDVERGLANYLNVGIGLAFGQSTGNSGDGGIVTINSNANISTSGTGSNGIFAQSIGGGGGVAGGLGNDLPVLSVLNFAGSVGGAGSGKLVSVTQVGTITTTGDASDGIFAQSAGGTGTGSADLGGAVNVSVTGDILTTGAESNGIFAQSIGGSGQNDITVTIVSGTIQGGSDTGSGVRFANGNNNTLTNSGTIQTLAGMSGTSIFGTGGNVTVNNYGTVNDSISLSGATNIFNNNTGALLQSGDYIDLGAGNTLNDAGTISPGGIGTIQTTALTGNFALTGNANWIFDLTPAFSSDQFNISGTAQLNGHVNSLSFNELGLATGPGTYTLITAASGGLTGAFQFGSMTGGTMPVGLTFTLDNSDQQEQLTVSVSTGPFYWRGTVDNTWNGAFLNGQDNWTSDAAGSTFIFGTPGAVCDVFFASTNVNTANLNTILGADFAVNSLTFETPTAVGIGGNNTLTIEAGSGTGITVDSGSGAVTISANLALGGNQSWTNNSTNPLSVTGTTVSGTGQNLTIDGTGTTIISSVIQTGTGSLTKNGTGALLLSGQSTYSGGTILNTGTLNLDTNSTPTGAVPSVSPVLSGPVGAGTLQINGGIVGTSTNSGTNTIHSIGNTVQVNASFAVSNVVVPPPSKVLSSIDGGVLNSFAAGFFNSDGVNFAGQVLLNEPGAATVITTNSGFLDITGSIHDLTSGSSGGLTFAGNSFTYLGGAGVGTKGLTGLTGQLDVSNTYSGLTTVSSGVLVLGKNNYAIAIPGDLQINAGAYVQFDGANNVNRVGALGVTPNQIYTGATVTDNGTLDLAGIDQTIAALFGSGIVRLDDSALISGTPIGERGVLTVGSGDFSGTIIDAGAGGQLIKMGPGTLVLSGTNTFVGPTMIDDGILVVDGRLSSPQVYVNPGAILKGTGIIDGNLINIGMVAPGHSPGTLQVTGNYTQSPAGVLQIEIAGVGAGQHDLLSIDGHATLGGTLDLVQLNNFKLKRGETVTFLTATGGVSGSFLSVVNPFTSSTILDPMAVIHGDSVDLEMVQGSFVKFAQNWGLTPNQRSVAAALDSAVSDQRANSLINYLDGRGLTRLPGDFDKIAPAELTSIFTIGVSLAQVQSQNIQGRTDDIRSGANGFSAQRFSMTGSDPSYSGGLGLATGAAGPNGNGDPESKEMKTTAAPDERWGAFLSGTGEWVSVGSTENARGYNLTSGGFTLGVDYKLTPNFAIGLMAGYTGTSADLTDHGRIMVNGGKIGLYATTFVGGWYADVAATGGYNSYDTRRSALQGEARGDTDGGDINALFGTGYDFKRGGLTFGPTATFNYTDVATNGYTEYGSLAPLNVHGGNGESLRTAFGFKASYDWKCGGILIKPELHAAWQHEFGAAAYALDSSFANGAGDSFLVNGPQLGRDSALLGAGFAIQFSERLSTYFYYNGELGRTNYESNSVTGGVGFAF